MSTHYLCFGLEIRNVYPCTPQLYYIKAGCYGVFISQTCFPDGVYMGIHFLFLIQNKDSGYSLELPPHQENNMFSSDIRKRCLCNEYLLSTSHFRLKFLEVYIS